MTRQIPQIKFIHLSFKNRTYGLEYFIREGDKGVILFIHGLGGAKENFWEAVKSTALEGYCLLCFDNPGTGNSTYFEDQPLEVDDLVEITSLFIDQLKLNNFILAGASMGGLITMHYMQQTQKKIKAYINIEGNLMPEDCMFSSKVVQHAFDHFANTVYPKTIEDMKKYANPGYHIIANNLELNTNIKAYYHYSFQTVKYSATGLLLNQYLEMDIPRLFIYGEKNKNLSYIPLLKAKGMPTQMIPNSDHFIFYDNPKTLYQSIEQFIKPIN